MSDLFAYGTLMCQDIMTSVAGVELNSVRGVLKEYRRMELKNEHFPAIVEDNGGEVEGVVYLGIPPSGIEQLDSFEGQIYQRILVEIHLGDGGMMKAWTYVLKKRYHNMLGSREWDYKEFLKSGKRVFVSSYSGYGQIC